MCKRTKYSACQSCLTSRCVSVNVRICSPMQMQHGAWVQACVAHEVIDGPRFAAISVDGVSFMDALAAWFYDDTVVQVRRGRLPDARYLPM